MQNDVSTQIRHELARAKYAGKIHKTANLTTGIIFLVLIVLATRTRLFALPSLPVGQLLALMAATWSTSFWLGYKIGFKLQFDRLYMLVNSLAWIAVTILTVKFDTVAAHGVEKIGSMFVYATVVAYSTAVAARGLYSKLANPMEEAQLCLALQVHEATESLANERALAD